MGFQGAVLHLVAVGEAVHAAVLQLHKHVVPRLQRVREGVSVLPAPLVVAAAHLRPRMHRLSSAGARSAAAWASGRPWLLSKAPDSARRPACIMAQWTTEALQCKAPLLGALENVCIEVRVIGYRWVLLRRPFLQGTSSPLIIVVSDEGGRSHQTCVDIVGAAQQ